MQTPGGRPTIAVIPHDRRREFVAALSMLAPSTAAGLETIALYTMIAAFWGVILYMALGAVVR